MPTIDTKQFTGRKSRVGTVAFDKNGAVCVVAGYCPACNSKVLWYPEELREFSRRWDRQRRRFINRMLTAALNKRAV